MCYNNLIIQQEVIVLPAYIKGKKSSETKEIDAKTRENKIIKRVPVIRDMHLQFLQQYLSKTVLIKRKTYKPRTFLHLFLKSIVIIPSLYRFLHQPVHS